MNGDSNEPIVTPTPLPPNQKRNVIIISILLLLIGGFFMFASVLRHQISTKQPAPSLSDTTLIATVSDKQFFLGDVKNVAREQYLESAVDNQVLKISLDTLIERTLLDSEAKKYKITVTDQEVQEALGNAPPQLINIKRYELLKEKLTPKLIQSRKAFTVGFWIAPENYQGAVVNKQMESLMKQQRKDALPALTEIEKQLREGKEALSVAKDVIKQYPSLERIMAVNGYYVLRTENESILINPREYTPQQSDKQSKVLFETIFRLQPGQIALAQDLADNAGGFIIKVITVSDNPYDNEEAWLKDQRKKLVTIHQML